MTESRYNASSSSLRVVGQSVTRTDGRAKITGELKFSADRVKVKGLLNGKTLRSPHPHAEIIGIDVSKVERFPGPPGGYLPIRGGDPFRGGAGAANDGALTPVFVLNRTVRHEGTRCRRGLMDIPPIEAVLIEQPDSVGPYGAKALGVSLLVPLAGAIANAVYDATGALPITQKRFALGSV